MSHEQPDPFLDDLHDQINSLNKKNQELKNILQKIIDPLKDNHAGHWVWKFVRAEDWDNAAWILTKKDESV